MKRKKRFELTRLSNIIILAKKPINGGTPAIDKNKIVNVETARVFCLTSIKEFIVLRFVVTNCINVQNKKIKDMLYKKI
jgi:hypothetical protein